MNSILQLFIIIPLIGYIFSLFIPSHKERMLSLIGTFTASIQLITFIGFFTFWMLHQHRSIDLNYLTLYKSQTFHFFIDLSFDKVSAVFLFVGAFLTLLINLYSRHYLHRESGYKRFFNTILFFYFGYNVTILAGNMETLFLGWEILGISSFLLIAFYRDRYLPVKNSVKVFSIYRIGDIGLMLAIWMNHHLWHENVSFTKFLNADLVNEHIEQFTTYSTFFSLAILVAALGKSAQFPFSSWLPRAMEGPTPSSAIFYGSLSVHLGVFLLLRTFPFWEHQTLIRVTVIVFGVLTVFVASGTSRVQSSIKSQIAYASIAQIGIIFIEIALGLTNFALFHFAGNAFLRTYQLLVSPSVVTYLIRDQFYNFTNKPHILRRFVPRKIERTFYMLCIKEWNLDTFMTRFIWAPMKTTNKYLNFPIKTAMILFVPAYLIGILLLYYRNYFPDFIMHQAPLIFVITGHAMVIKSYTEKESVFISWILIIMNHLWITLAVSFNEIISMEQITIYLSGIVVSGILGYACLRYMKSHEKIVDLKSYHGHIYEHPIEGILFLITCLGLSAFPITSSFVGEDLILSHVHSDQIILATIIAVSFMINGLSAIRIYARVFLGQHEKTYHEVAYKSS
ncbi:MAG: proton-conducting transporter membrane subunit [Bacteroidota bacterium]|nr:proton-conducting transporter membrane subunit [Bacteroidota bacterium]